MELWFLFAGAQAGCHGCQPAFSSTEEKKSVNKSFAPIYFYTDVQISPVQLHQCSPLSLLANDVV
jgi:hypothetical protein